MALQILMQRSDQVLDAALSNYLKLKNIVGEDKKITETLINENIDRSLSENIFEILTAAFNKNYQGKFSSMNTNFGNISLTNNNKQ